MKCPAFKNEICVLTGCDTSCLQKGNLPGEYCRKYRIDSAQIKKVFESARNKLVLRARY